MYSNVFHEIYFWCTHLILDHHSILFHVVGQVWQSNQHWYFDYFGLLMKREEARLRFYLVFLVLIDSSSTTQYKCFCFSFCLWILNQMWYSIVIIVSITLSWCTKNVCANNQKTTAKQLKNRVRGIEKKKKKKKLNAK